jgi:hypothetical protein
MRRMIPMSLVRAISAVFGARGVGGVAADEDVKAAPGRVRSASMPLSPSGEWSLEEILALDRDATIALWKTLPAAPMAELDGHYQGLVPNAGDSKLQSATRDHMYNESSPSGYWLGKAYRPLTATTGEGYNRWRFPGGKVVRNLRFATEMGNSLIDGKPSLLMYYGAFNDSTMVDEIRKLDDYIYLGASTSEARRGKRTEPEHFVLIGPTDEWVGVGNS